MNNPEMLAEESNIVSIVGHCERVLFARNKLPSWVNSKKSVNASRYLKNFIGSKKYDLLLERNSILSRDQYLKLE